ncbi:MAG: GNAT family N-acetyltransferase [Myxococcales bacterium]|nr:GNAT family N-acetyltransferase [Myxococcales bacterium]
MPTDAQDLARVRREAIGGLASTALGHVQARQWADSATPARIERAIHAHETWVVEVGSVVAGWVEVCEDEIRGLYVGPRWSQGGLGSLLLDKAEALIRAAGFEMAKLDASPNAADFYHRRGYRARARSEDGAVPMSKPFRCNNP